MADYYVRSTDGLNTDAGTTWALAKATLAGASNLVTGGDRIFISQAHNESNAAAVTITANGISIFPAQLLGASDAAEPPTSLSTAPVVGVTGNFTLTINGNFYAYGITFITDTSGSASASSNLILNANAGIGYRQLFKSCSFRLGSTATTARINIGSSTMQWVGEVVWEDVTIRLSNSGQRISLADGDLIWRGGSIVPGSSTPITNGLFSFGQSGRTGRVLVEGVDFSNFSSSLVFVNDASSFFGLVLRNCKLPAGWAGSLFLSPPTLFGARAEMYNCDNADTNYRLWIEDYSGTTRDETTIVRAGGASDGTSSFSWKLSSSVYVGFPSNFLVSPELSRWQDTVGSPITVTVEILTDGVTLKDNECWLDVQYLGTSGFPLGAIASDQPTDVLTTAANQATSSADWTTTGLTTPTKQKLSVTITPQERGHLIATVRLTKPSTTVYVDPTLTVV